MSGEQLPRDYRESHLHEKKGETYERDLAAEPFDAYMAARESEILTRIVPKLFPKGVARYVDFACGTGRITRLIEAFAQQSYGIDISASMLEQARASCKKTTFFECDATVQPPDFEPVQLVTSFRFFGHAQDELRMAALRTIHRMLTPDGYFIFNNHCNPRSLHNLLLRLRGAQLLRTSGGGPINFHHAKMKALLRAADFKLVSTHGIGLWVIRSGFMREGVLQSRTARMLEPLSRLPLVGRFCPDAVLVRVRNS